MCGFEVCHGDMRARARERESVCMCVCVCVCVCICYVHPATYGQTQRAKPTKDAIQRE